MPRELRSFRTLALILKRRDMGEADRLVTLFTPERGKLDVLAKGARKPISTKTGHVELFTRAEILVAKGRTFDIMTQAEMQQPYLPLREDLLRGAYASYTAELLDRFTQENDAHPTALFALLDATWARLSYEQDLRKPTRFYELNLLAAVGFRPQLNECVITHEPITPKDQFFSYSEGGVVSQEGAAHVGGLVPLPLGTLKLLRHLQRSSYKQLAPLQIEAPLHNDTERIMLGYIRYLLERKLQSVEFIRLLGG
jgi:DNA repair protein RecO (recombination protein O)